MGAKGKKGQFTSSWGFILSAVGSAVGMANVWGFPAKMGSRSEEHTSELQSPS